MYPLQLTPSVVVVARGIGYLLVAAAGLGLLWYLRAFVQRLLAEPYRTRWRYLAVGIGAVVVYGVAGFAEVVGINGVEPFRRGATLFVFLFVAIGIRAVHRSVGGEPILPDATLRWLGPAVIAGSVLTWWAAYLFVGVTALVVVEFVGLGLTVAYALYHAVGTVHQEEGTSIAAFIRQFVPALLALATVAVAEHVGTLVPDLAAVGEGVALVGTVLAGAFLFTTAVAIRQQGGELERLYDPTTWREEESHLTD